MSDHDRRSVQPLVVRTRQVVGAHEGVSEATVHCPRRDTSIPAAECMACADSAGIVTGADGSTYLSCAHPAAQQAAFAEIMRQPLFASTADRTPLSEVMTRHVVCVLPDLDLGDLMELFLERNIGGAPVVDQDGRPIGVVSRTDLLGSFKAGTVADVMVPMAFVLPESATLSQAAALMAFEGVHRIPVVSSEGRVVGIVSALDVARWLAQSDGYIEPGSSRLTPRGSVEDE
ncbi:MAG TPA: CBS domain-containing protein [Candidatus Acidoferrum sp.]|nr:CBS domain-containing protein [Candidatus Acidoferrum sp.]